MDKDAYLEINASQRPALALFEAMGYTYISPADCDKQRGSRYHVLLRDILRGQLRRLNRYAYAGAENEFSAANIERAIKRSQENSVYQFRILLFQDYGQPAQEE